MEMFSKKALALSTLRLDRTTSFQTISNDDSIKLETLHHGKQPSCPHNRRRNHRSLTGIFGRPSPWRFTYIRLPNHAFVFGLQLKLRDLRQSQMYFNRQVKLVETCMDRFVQTKTQTQKRCCLPWQTVTLYVCFMGK